jgi:hypothetical protein
MIDENMENYTSVHNWMYGIGFPESTKQYKSLITNEDNERDPKRVFSDGTLSILDSDYNENVVIKFTDLFPNYLSSLEFNTQLKDPTNNYLMAEARFEYTLYNIRTANS